MDTQGQCFVSFSALLWHYWFSDKQQILPVTFYNSYFTLCGTTKGVSQHQKDKPFWISLKKRWWSGSDISWTIRKSLAPRSKQTTKPTHYHSCFLQARHSSSHPTDNVKALKALMDRWTEGIALPAALMQSAITCLSEGQYTCFQMVFSRTGGQLVNLYSPKTADRSELVAVKVSGSVV